MNKCIRCGESTNINLYEDRKNIYYGEYLCCDCNSIITAEWGLDKETQETMMRFVKEDDISVMEYVAIAVRRQINRLNNMTNIVGNTEEALDLIAVDDEATYKEYIKLKSLVEKMKGEEE